MYTATDADKDNPKSRSHELDERLFHELISEEEYGKYVKIPTIDEEFKYILGYINELGFFINTGMGAIPLSYTEIANWAMLTDVDPSPFDVRVLRQMSSAFISYQDKSKKPECPDPIKELEELENGDSTENDNNY